MPLPAIRLIVTGIVIIALGATAGLLTADDRPQTSPTVRGLTAVDGVKVGHYTLAERPTGYTVILTDGGGVDVRGGAPGTREIALLDPVNLVQQVHGIVLAGGSAFGLDAATGVVRNLEERGIGYETRLARVPIVPGAILMDLGVGDAPDVRPTAECGYQAAMAATSGAVAEGNVGAGATIGKLRGSARAMKGGLGTASIQLENGLTVVALVAADVMAEAIVRAATQATGIPGYPAAGDLDGSRP